jgi:hypothetical protein
VRYSRAVVLNTAACGSLMQINLVRLRSVYISMSVLKVVNFSGSLEKGCASKPWVPETLADAGVSLHLDLQKITTPVSRGVGS